MSQLLAVMAGGALGAAARFEISQLARRSFGEYAYWGTGAINILGSFLIGVAFALLFARASGPAPAHYSAFFITGVLGGFTTFSAFSLEMLSLIQAGRLGEFLAYGAISLCASIGAAFLGYVLFAP